MSTKTSKKKKSSKKKALSKRKASNLCELVNSLTPAQKKATESIVSLFDGKVLTPRKVTKFAETVYHKAYPDSKPEKKLKRPLNAYMLFAKDYREGVTAKSPDFTLGEVAKELGDMWKYAQDDLKTKYKKDATKLLEEYKKIQPSATKKATTKKAPTKKNTEWTGQHVVFDNNNNHQMIPYDFSQDLKQDEEKQKKKSAKTGSTKKANPLTTKQVEWLAKHPIAKGDTKSTKDKRRQLLLKDSAFKKQE
jgi:hypothetical protein